MEDLLKSPLMRGWRTQAERGTLAKLGTLPIENKTPYFLVKDVLLPTLANWERALLNTGALKVIQVNPAKRAKGGKSSAKVTKAAIKAGVDFYLAGQLTAKSSKGERGEIVEYTLSVTVHEAADSSLRWRYDGKTEFLVGGSADTTTEPRRVVLHIENRRSEKWDSRLGGAKPDMRLRVNGKVQGPLCKDSDRCVFGCGFALKVPQNKPLRVKVVDSDTLGKDQTMGNLKSCPFPIDSSTTCSTPWLNVTLHPYSKVTCDALSKTRAKMF